MSAAIVIVAALLGVVAVVVVLLAVPIELRFQGRGVEPFEGQVALRWLFGLVRFRVHLPDAARRPPGAAPSRHRGTGAEAEPPARRRAPRGKSRAGAARTRAMAALRQPAFRRRALRLAVDLVRAAHLREFVLRLRLGLGDPADTGRLWAWLGPLAAALQSLRHAQVRLEPEFVDPVLEFELHGRARLVPLQWLALLVAFALSPPAWRAWQAASTAHA